MDMRPEEDEEDLILGGRIDAEDSLIERGVTNCDLLCLLAALIMMFCVIMWYPRSSVGTTTPSGIRPTFARAIER
jgi:hypothetical protein